MIMASRNILELAHPALEGRGSGLDMHVCVIRWRRQQLTLRIQESPHVALSRWIGLWDSSFLFTKRWEPSTIYLFTLQVYHGPG